MDFSTLVRVSHAIVLGRVVDVSKVKGVKIARVKVLQTYKGQKVDELFLLAQATWTCDISEAVKGETALLFLRQYPDQPERFDEMFSPLPSRQDLERAGVGKVMFLIGDSGRGRMPLRMITGHEYATLWVDDVQLPASVHTVDGPNPKYTFIRSVLLTDIVELLGSSVTWVARSER